MAAGDLVTVGTAVATGFNGNTNTNILMQAVTESMGDATIKEIPGEQGATVTKLATNPHYRIRLTGVVLAAGTELATLEAMKKGDTLSVNSVNCMINSDISIEMSAEEARVTIEVINEDSMTYS